MMHLQGVYRRRYVDRHELCSGYYDMYWPYIAKRTTTLYFARDCQWAFTAIQSGEQC